MPAHPRLRIVALPLRLFLYSIHLLVAATLLLDRPKLKDAAR